MNKPGITLGEAYQYSLAFHFLLALFLWHFSSVQLYTRYEEKIHEAAVTHESTYRQTASSAYTERIQRMDELLARLGREEQSKEAQDSATSQTTDGKPASAEAEPNQKDTKTGNREDSQTEALSDLWQQSRDHYNELRKRCLDSQAGELSRITGMDRQKAIEQAEQKSKDVLNGQAASPNDQAQAAAQIAMMEADARRMFSEQLRTMKAAKEGNQLSPDMPSEVYRLMQDGPGNQNLRRFDRVVDYTPLMISKLPDVNSHLDTPEDKARLAAAQNREILQHYHRTANQLCFTRRIGGAAATQRAAWIAPDSWYIIGPFPNPQRSQIETRFPPELEIDRDAAYETSDGNAVTWHYTRNHTLGVVPPHMTDFAVYYAYTEIHCAEATDCWLAIGSDDYTKLWVNDLLVWRSSKDEKIWVPAEGFRKVHLNQGINRFLLRLENGINGCEFSVLIGLNQTSGKKPTRP